MCYNVIDGRLHLLCQHFIPMSTRQQDCLRNNCLFSRNHDHPVGCRSNACTRLMQPPQRNPIRISESLCADCIIRGNGRGVLGCT